MEFRRVRLRGEPSGGLLIFHIFVWSDLQRGVVCDNSEVEKSGTFSYVQGESI